VTVGTVRVTAGLQHDYGSHKIAVEILQTEKVKDDLGKMWERSSR